MTDRDRAFFRSGVRAAITWLHAEARKMNDPHAHAILNAAGFHLGVEAQHWRAPAEPSASEAATPASQSPGTNQ